MSEYQVVEVRQHKRSRCARSRLSGAACALLALGAAAPRRCAPLRGRCVVPRGRRGVAPVHKGLPAPLGLRPNPRCMRACVRGRYWRLIPAAFLRARVQHPPAALRLRAVSARRGAPARWGASAVAPRLPRSAFVRACALRGARWPRCLCGAPALLGALPVRSRLLRLGFPRWLPRGLAGSPLGRPLRGCGPGRASAPGA